MNTFFYTYFGSVLLAVVLTPWVIRLARRIGAVDQPGLRGVHQRPIPRIGGVAIFLSAMCPIVAVLVLDNPIGAASRNVQGHLTALLCCSTLMFLVGLADDLKDVPARRKLLAELLIAGLLCGAGVRVSSIALTHQWVLSPGRLGLAADGGVDRRDHERRQSQRRSRRIGRRGMRHRLRRHCDLRSPQRSNRPGRLHAGPARQPVRLPDLQLQSGPHLHGRQRQSVPGFYHRRVQRDVRRQVRGAGRPCLAGPDPGHPHLRHAVLRPASFSGRPVDLCPGPQPFPPSPAGTGPPAAPRGDPDLPGDPAGRRSRAVHAGARRSRLAGHLRRRRCC